MEINKDDILELQRVYGSYANIHNEIEVLERNMNNLLVEKNRVLEKLNNLRESEKELINKIEKDTGVNLTTDELKKITTL